MKRKLSLLLLILLLGSIISVHAQDSTPTPTPEVNTEEEIPLTVDEAMHQLEPLAREIYTVLGWGDYVFEADLWRVTATEQPERTTAQWTAIDLGAVSYFDYLHFDTGVNLETLDEYFNDVWFTSTLGGYDSWERIETCTEEGLTLHLFDLQLGENDYAMRYWIYPATSTRVLTAFITMPKNNPDDMGIYADRLFPQLPDCNG